jgi:hypothetical protein
VLDEDLRSRICCLISHLLFVLSSRVSCQLESDVTLQITV